MSQPLTLRMISRMQVTEKSFSLLERATSLDIQKELTVDFLLLCVKMS